MVTKMHIQKVSVIGAGMMGRRIAWACLAHGQTVKLMSRKESSLQDAVREITHWLATRVPKVENVDAALERLSLFTNLDEAVIDVDLIYENIDENVDLKTQLLEELGAKAASQVLMGSNTASIPCHILAKASGRPKQFFNMNCDEPVELSFVEIMGSLPTADSEMAATLDTAAAWAESIGQVAIRVNADSQGYAFNRTWRAIKREYLHLAGNGVCSHEDLDRMFMLSFQSRSGPFGMMDHVGLANILNVERQYYHFSKDERDKPPKMLEDMVANGHLGVTTGKGFYDYPNPAYENPEWLRKEKTRS
jgi:3-hydroxybutyryl-CoA dehydrogenase